MMIDLGDIYQVAVDIRNAAGVLTNPSTATLTITLPDGTATSPSVTLPPASTGQLRVDYTTVQAGRHVYRMTTAGPTTAHADVFDVRPAAPELIVSLEDAKKHLNITGAADDEELRSMIDGVAAPIEQYVGAVARRSETEVFDGGRCTVLLAHIPLVQVTEVRESGVVMDTGAYTANTVSGVVTRVVGVRAYPFRDGVRNVEVTYVAGRPLVPGNIRLAALIILQHMWETQRPAGGGPFTQQSDDFDPRYTYSIPRRALELLGEPIGGIA